MSSRETTPPALLRPVTTWRVSHDVRNVGAAFQVP